MRSLVAKAVCVAALLAVASQAHAQDGQSLVRVLDRTTADGQTTTSTFAVPTTPGRSTDRWFVTVARGSAQARGTVTLNGATLLDERAFQGTSALLLRVEVQPALANTLLTASRSGALQVLVDGVVADAPGGPLGPHVLFMRLFDDRFGPTGADRGFSGARDGGIVRHWPPSAATPVRGIVPHPAVSARTRTGRACDTAKHAEVGQPLREESIDLRCADGNHGGRPARKGEKRVLTSLARRW